MSETIVDMPKVTQMLDAGWRVIIKKNDLGSYTAEADHQVMSMLDRVRTKLIESHEDRRQSLKTVGMLLEDMIESCHFSDGGTAVVTNDFTPAQALTRLAYKLHGEII